MKLITLAMMPLFVCSAFANTTTIKAFYNETEKCGIIDLSNEAFFEMFQLKADGSFKKTSGVNWTEENYSSRDLKRLDQVPVSHFYGGSPIADSFLVVVKAKNNETYNFQRYDEAFSSSIFPKNTTLCGNMKKLTEAQIQELASIYKIK